MSETQNTQQPANAQQNNQSGNGDAANNSGQNTNTQQASTYTQGQLDSMVQERTACNKFGSQHYVKR